jgi:hypothetical protein
LTVHVALSFFFQDYGYFSTSFSSSNWRSKQVTIDPEVYNTTELIIDTSISLPDPISYPAAQLSPPAPTFSYRRRANATFVLLCRNSDLGGAVSSIQQLEDRFNREYKYPWVLLNEEPFTEEFKK